MSFNDLAKAVCGALLVLVILGSLAWLAALGISQDAKLHRECVAHKGGVYLSWDGVCIGTGFRR